jgi:hypothetical protein
MVAVVALSISPLSMKLKLHTIGVYHDAGHYVVYALSGIMLWLVVKRWFLRVITFGLGVSMAFLQEWAENAIYHAGFEWKDVGTDLAGLVSGFALMLLIMALTMDDSARQRY